MFQRRGLIALVLFVAGCATASEPPVQQAVVSEPVWVATSQSAVSDLPSVVVEKSPPSLAQQPKRSAVVQPKQVVPDTYPSDSVRSKVTPKTASVPDDNAIIRYVLAIPATVRVLMTVTERDGVAAAEVPIPNRAGIRRCAIRAM